VLGRCEEYVQDGKAALFDTLKPCLLGSRELQPYAAVAAELHMTEGAVKVAVCRLRERYRDRLREEIAHTVASPRMWRKNCDTSFSTGRQRRSFRRPVTFACNPYVKGEGLL
jgi:hypothetical protein